MGVSAKVNETNVKAEDLLPEAEAVMTAAQGTSVVQQLVADRINSIPKTASCLKAPSNINRRLSVILLSQV